MRYGEITILYQLTSFPIEDFTISKFIFWNLSPLFLWMGFTWLVGQRQVPGYSMILPRHTRIRLVNKK